MDKPLPHPSKYVQAGQWAFAGATCNACLVFRCAGEFLGTAFVIGFGSFTGDGHLRWKRLFSRSGYSGCLAPCMVDAGSACIPGHKLEDAIALAGDSCGRCLIGPLDGA